MLSDELIKVIVTQFPAIAALLYIVHRQEKLIKTVMDACLKHFGGHEDETGNPL